VSGPEISGPDGKVKQALTRALALANAKAQTVESRVGPLTFEKGLSHQCHRRPAVQRR